MRTTTYVFVEKQERYQHFWIKKRLICCYIKALGFISFNVCGKGSGCVYVCVCFPAHMQSLKRWLVRFVYFFVGLSVHACD